MNDIDDRPLECQKALFSIPPDVTYLNSAYMGPLPVATQQAGADALAARAVPTGLGADDFFAPAEAARRLCAGLIGAQAEQIALIPTTSYAVAIAAKNLSLRAGQCVVLPQAQFPSNVLAWRRLVAAGVELRTVAEPTTADVAASGRSRAALWNERLLEAIDARCAVLAIEPAHWTDGTRFDLDALAQRARSVGAAVIVDATQFVGAMPIDVARIRPDLLVAHAYKSMLSHYGLGFAYLGPRFSDGVPLEESWLMRRGAEDFSRLVDYEDDYAAGMRRYDSSLRSNPVLIRSLVASATLLARWRPARVEAYCRRIADAFVPAVRALGYGVADPGDRAANLFGLVAPAGIDVEGLRARLAAQRIHVSVRGRAIRVSPHVYNDAHDFERLLGALG
jgi:selenocysteine lyase/cysteine desulfurase